MRISFKELNEASTNPGTIRQKLQGQQEPPKFGGHSYYLTLVNSIHHFHKNYNDRFEGETYLLHKLETFSNTRQAQKRKDYIVEQYDWYIDEYFDREIISSDTKVNVHIIPNVLLKTDLVISGEVSRIDLEITGGYTVWMFRNGSRVGWKEEISMPLIQYEVSHNIFNVPDSEVSMGVCSFTDRAFEQYHFSEQEIADAKSQLTKLLEDFNLA